MEKLPNMSVNELVTQLQSSSLANMMTKVKKQQKLMRIFCCSDVGFMNQVTLVILLMRNCTRFWIIDRVSKISKQFRRSLLEVTSDQEYHQSRSFDNRHFLSYFTDR